jgi:fibronectin type 3 domain-containing protein
MKKVAFLSFFCAILLSAVYSAPIGWWDDVQLTGTSTESSYPDIEAIGQDFYVVWQEEMGGYYDIFISTSSDYGCNWSVPKNISNSSSDSKFPKVSFLNIKSRVIFIVWQEYITDHYEIYSSRSIDVGSNWITPESISRSNTANAINVDCDWIKNFPQTRDEIIVTWQDNRTGNEDIYFTRGYFTGNDTSQPFVWDDGHNPANVDQVQNVTNSLGDQIHPTISDSLQGPMIGWVDNGIIYGIRSEDWGHTWGSISGFGPTPVPENISDTTVNTADYPDLTWNNSNHAFAWIDNLKILAKIAMGGLNLSWSGEFPIKWGFVDSVDLSSKSGIVHSVFQDEVSGDNQIFYSETTNDGNTWTIPIQLSNSSNNAEQPAIGCDFLGNSPGVVWQDNRDGNWEIYFKRYDDDIPFKPLLPSATGAELAVNVSWRANAECDVVGYNLYRSTTAGNPNTYTVSIAALVTGTTYYDSPLDPASTYYYVITAVDRAQNESTFSDEVFAQPLPVAPPTTLTAMQGNQGAYLSWTASLSDGSLISGYNLYRSTTAGNPNTYAIQISTNQTGTTYTDTGLINGTTYYYVSTTVDIYDNESDYSNETYCIPILPPPDNFQALPGNTEAYLSWDTVNNAVGYNLYRRTTATTYAATINGALITGTTYTDTGLTNGETYYYVATAIDNDSFESNHSNEDWCIPSTDTTPPSIPANLAATANYSSDSIELNWDISTDASGIKGYNIYRSTASGTGYIKIVNSITDLSYSDSTINMDIKYYYVVTAVDSSVSQNESNYSNEDSAILQSFPSNVDNIKIYPNPVKPKESNLIFDNLPNGTEIKIYSLTGREVYNITTTNPKWEWELENDKGKKIASGVYYCIINYEGNIIIKKVAIIK